MSAAVAVLPRVVAEVEVRLAQARSIEELADVRDDLAALSRRVGKSLQVGNRVVLARVLAERRLGGLLVALGRSAGGRPSAKTPARLAGVSPYRAALQRCGIPERSAERYQLVWRWVDEARIHALSRACCEAAEEFTATQVYEAAESACWVATYAWRAPVRTGLGHQRRKWLILQPPRSSGARTITTIEWLTEGRRARFEALVRQFSPPVPMADLLLSLLEQEARRTGGTA